MVDQKKSLPKPLLVRINLNHQKMTCPLLGNMAATITEGTQETPWCELESGIDRDH